MLAEDVMPDDFPGAEDVINVCIATTDKRPMAILADQQRSCNIECK